MRSEDNKGEQRKGEGENIFLFFFSWGGEITTKKIKRKEKKRNKKFLIR